jgi:predicted transposase YbfD/YdcC
LLDIEIKSNLLSIYGGKYMTENKKKHLLLTTLQIIPDPRIDRCKKHSLESILFIALVGMLCGADSFIEIEDFAEGNLDWIKKCVDLPNGVPSHDTICRVFSLIEKDKFCELFTSWTQSLNKEKPEKVIAIDGKTLCGALGNDLKDMAHILHAWSVENGICIGQQAVKNKSNEITAMEPLLKMLDLEGCIITADALHSHKQTANWIVQGSGDYVLPIKDNEKDFREEIEFLFKDAFAKDFKGFDADNFETLEKSHGRIEQRKYWVLDAEELPSAKAWAKLRSVGLCERERTVKEKTTKERVFFAMSLGIDAKRFGEVARSHWQVENGLHWSLDVVFREDKQRYRDKVMAQNFSCLRKIVFNVLKKDSRKKSLKSKRFKAAYDLAYREEVLKNYL